MKSAFVKLGLVLGALCGATAVQAQLAVVVGNKSAATPLTAEQASNLFLGKTDKLPGAGTVVLIDQSESSQVREAFYSKVAGKTAPQVKAIWSRLVFSGKGEAPKEMGNSGEVKKAVAADPNAIGYIEKAAVDGSVKVLLSVD